MSLLAERKVIPPEGGWAPHTWYLVEKAHNYQNPIHMGLFYSGFITNDAPSGYNGAISLNGTDDAPTAINRLYYLRVIRPLVDETAETAALYQRRGISLGKA